MMYIFKMIQQVAGKNSRSLYLPVALSCVDALLHMGMFSTMILTIIELIGGIFTVEKLTLYSIVLGILFLVRNIGCQCAHQSSNAVLVEISEI